MEIFKDAGSLREDHIPNIIHYREKQIDKFRMFFFNGPTIGRSSGHLFIQGPPGTGKTLCTHYLVEETEEKLDGSVNTGIFYVNCNLHPSQKKTARALAKKVGVSMTIPKSADLSEIMEYVFDKIDEKYKFALIILDEVDKILPKRNERDTLFYILVRARELKLLTDTYQSIACIANDIRCREKLGEGTRDSFGSYWVHFDRYDESQLQGILWQRAEKAFNPGVVDKNVISSIARYCYNTGGSARQALNLLNIAAREAESRNKEEITLHEFNLAKFVQEKKILQAEINNMGFHKKLLLYTLYSIFYTNKRHYHLKVINNAYRKVCKKLLKEPLKMGSIRNYFKEFVEDNLVEEYFSDRKVFYKPLLEPETVKGLLDDFYMEHDIKAVDFNGQGVASVAAR